MLWYCTVFQSWLCSVAFASNWWFSNKCCCKCLDALALNCTIPSSNSYCSYERAECCTHCCDNILSRWSSSVYGCNGENRIKPNENVTDWLLLRAAANRCRQKKKEWVSKLEVKVERMNAVNHRLQVNNRSWNKWCINESIVMVQL